MHIVVTQLPLVDGVDWLEFQSKVDQFQGKLSAERPEFRGVSLVRVSDNKAILVVLFNDRESLDDISSNLAAPWFADNLKSYLAGPVDRQVGEIVAGSMK